MRIEYHAAQPHFMLLCSISRKRSLHFISINPRFVNRDKPARCKAFCSMPVTEGDG